MTAVLAAAGCEGSIRTVDHGDAASEDTTVDAMAPGDTASDASTDTMDAATAHGVWSRVATIDQNLLAITAAPPATIWALDDSYQLHVSSDGASTWTTVAPPNFSGEGGTYWSYEPSLSLNPASGRLLLGGHSGRRLEYEQGTWTSLGTEVGPIRFGGGRGVSRTGQVSLDDAVTFGPAPPSVPCNGRFGVGIDPAGGAWASCFGTIYGNPDGAAWQTVGTYDDALLDVGPDGAIYALGATISRSRDGAKTWQVLGPINHQAFGGSVDGGGVVPFGPKGAIIVFAMLFYTTDGGGNPIGEIFISLDGGDSFVVSSDVGIPAPTGTMFYPVGGIERVGSDGQHIWAVGFDQKLYAYSP